MPECDWLGGKIVECATLQQDFSCAPRKRQSAKAAGFSTGCRAGFRLPRQRPASAPIRRLSHQGFLGESG